MASGIPPPPPGGKGCCSLRQGLLEGQIWGCGGAGSLSLKHVECEMPVSIQVNICWQLAVPGWSTAETCGPERILGIIGMCHG